MKAWRERIAVGLIVATAMAMATAATVAGDGLPAFPGAEGAGAMTAGGRGGEVYAVTTLADAGPGSFRDAVSKGNRTIVFRVGGTIRLESAVHLRQGNLTIAGQTAPGGGICIADYSVNVRASDIVIRHLRFRLGDLARQQSDAFTIWHGSRRIILDHCSVSWSVDEALSLAGDVQDVTVQWCIISEALRGSVHQKGEHGYGSLSRATGLVSWHHNLWAHNDSRNPRLGDNYGKDPKPSFDVRNNVVYNYGDTAVGLTQGDFPFNYVGNTLRPGPDSTSKVPIRVGEKSSLRVYLRDNVFEADPTLQGEAMFDRVEHEGRRIVELATEPFAMPPVTTTPAKEAFEQVLAGAGATRPARDAADARVIEHVRTRTGRMIDSQAEVGGWPELAAGQAPPDGDGDGLPDAWEKANGLDPADRSDGAREATPGGYTHLEHYLNELAAAAAGTP